MSGGLSDRSWFSFRYSVPGYIFILLVTVINLDSIFKVLIVYGAPKNLDFGVTAVVGILAFISGPTLGFLIVQGYYVLFRRVGGYDLFLRPTRDELIRTKISRKTRNIRLTLTDSDYWFNTGLVKDQPLFVYLTRRWDLFNSLASAGSSICLSLLTGFMVRQYFFSNFPPEIAQIDWSTWLIEGMCKLQILVIVASLISMGFCFIGAWDVRRDHQEMVLKILEKRALSDMTLKRQGEDRPLVPEHHSAA